MLQFSIGLSGRPALRDLYRQAFQDFGVHALWNKRQLDSPTLEDALVIARALRIEGNLEAPFLAERIKQSCNLQDLRPSETTGQ